MSYITCRVSGFVEGKGNFPYFDLILYIIFFLFKISSAKKLNQVNLKKRDASLKHFFSWFSFICYFIFTPKIKQIKIVMHFYFILFKFILKLTLTFLSFSLIILGKIPYSFHFIIFLWSLICDTCGKHRVWLLSICLLTSSIVYFFLF